MESHLLKLPVKASGEGTMDDKSPAQDTVGDVVKAAVTRDLCTKM